MFFIIFIEIVFPDTMFYTLYFSIKLGTTRVVKYHYKDLSRICLREQCNSSRTHSSHEIWTMGYKYDMAISKFCLLYRSILSSVLNFSQHILSKLL